MISYSNISLGVDALESLRIPIENNDCPPDWKDWYHYILIDPSGGTKILMNISLSGLPGAGEIQVSLVVKQMGIKKEIETYAEVRSVPWEIGMVKRYPLAIITSNVQFRVKDGYSRIFMTGKNQDFHLDFIARPNADAFLIDEKAKFGNGFIGWGFVPSMSISGSYNICGKEYKIHKDWYCYHDRNFGRFRWGEDIGWEWMVANFKGNDNLSYQLIFDQRTNKDHTEKGFQYIFIFCNTKLKKVFVGNTLRLKWERENHSSTPLRLPGNMASVFSSQTSAKINTIEISARDDRDFVNFIFKTKKDFQLIVPDYEFRQFTVMEEVSGVASLNGILDGKSIKSKGHYYAEFVR